jgi:hypothetical protein
MLPQDSPVEKRRKEMPQGDCSWPGYEHVVLTLQIAASNLARGHYTCLSDDHIDIMAALGTGHEETMKYYVGFARCYKWV